MDHTTRHAARIAAAYLSHHPLPLASVATLIMVTRDAMENATAPPPALPAAPLVRPCSIKSSVQPEFLVCMEDGKRYKMLKRRIRTAFGLTPQEYRQKWGLPNDYPMVAPNYAARRSEFAKASGLGLGTHRRQMPKKAVRR